MMFTKEIYKVYKLQFMCDICQKIYEEKQWKSLIYGPSSIRSIPRLYIKKWVNFDNIRHPDTQDFHNQCSPIAL